MRWLRFSIWALLLVVGCNQTSVNRPSCTTMANAGGIVRSEDGQARLIVPSGALSQRVEVCLRPSNYNASTPQNSQIVDQTRYEATAQGISELALPATLEIVAPAGLPAGNYRLCQVVSDLLGNPVCVPLPSQTVGNTLKTTDLRSVGQYAVLQGQEFTLSGLGLQVPPLPDTFNPSQINLPAQTPYEVALAVLGNNGQPLSASGPAAPTLVRTGASVPALSTQKLSGNLYRLQSATPGTVEGVAYLGLSSVSFSLNFANVVTRVQLIPENAVTSVGGVVRFNAQAYGPGNVVIPNLVYLWSIEKPNIASVSPLTANAYRDADATGVSVGSTKVFAAVGNVRGEALLQVEELPPPPPPPPGD